MYRSVGYWVRYIKPTKYIAGLVNAINAKSETIFNSKNGRVEIYDDPYVLKTSKITKAAFTKHNFVAQHAFDNRFDSECKLGQSYSTKSDKFIKALGDAEHMVPIVQGNNIMCEEFELIRNNTIYSALRYDKKFRGIAGNMRHSKSDKKFVQQIGEDSEYSDEYIMKYMAPTTNDATSFEDTFASVEIHLDAATKEQCIEDIPTRFFVAHRDKVGQLVCVMNFQGTSYFFIIHNNTTKEYSGHITNGTGDSLRSLTDWLNHEDRTTKELQEFALFKQGLEINARKAWKKVADGNNTTHFCIDVYKMEPGARLILPAKTYYHGVMVPGGQLRHVALFHELETF